MQIQIEQNGLLISYFESERVSLIDNVSFNVVYCEFGLNELTPQRIHGHHARISIDLERG